MTGYDINVSRDLLPELLGSQDGLTKLVESVLKIRSVHTHTGITQFQIAPCQYPKWINSIFNTQTLCIFLLDFGVT